MIVVYLVIIIVFVFIVYSALMFNTIGFSLQVGPSPVYKVCVLG